ncbi:MAG: hypothetical protein IT385_03040 [Deltaproteobacteria bacterium]|nr:hypothetical protein [Deltaproteobacteria bacterium]
MDAVPHEPPQSAELIAELADALAPHGLDLVGAAPLAAYRAAVPPAFRLGWLPWPEADATIVAIGASRALWDAFMREVDAHPERRLDEHPLDGWIAPVIEDVADRVLADRPHDVIHYFEGDPPPRRVALQQLAEVTGLAGRAPCGLSIHPTLGPWLSLRAAIVVAASPAPPVIPTAWPCATCAERPCMPAFERAMAVTRGAGHAAIRAAADAWIAVRDACPVGHEARYSEPQILWHYLHDRAALEPAPPRMTPTP